MFNIFTGFTGFPLNLTPSSTALSGRCAPSYLCDGTAGRLVALQLNDDGRLLHTFARHEYQVGVALARWQLAVEDVVAVGIVEGDADDARERVFVVIPVVAEKKTMAQTGRP